RGGVSPGARITALALDVAAAEEDELLVVQVVAHGAPQEDAAELLLRMGRRRQVGPGASGRIVAERAAAGVEVQPLPVRVVVVLPAEREGPVDRPVGPDVALDVAEVPVFVLPRRRLTRAEPRAPLLALGERVLPTFLEIEREHIVGARLLVIGP